MTQAKTLGANPLSRGRARVWQQIQMMRMSAGMMSGSFMMKHVGPFKFVLIANLTETMLDPSRSPSPVPHPALF